MSTNNKYFQVQVFHPDGLVEKQAYGQPMKSEGYPTNVPDDKKVASRWYPYCIDISTPPLQKERKALVIFFNNPYEFLLEIIEQRLEGMPQEGGPMSYGYIVEDGSEYLIKTMTRDGHTELLTKTGQIIKGGDNYKDAWNFRIRIWKGTEKSASAKEKVLSIYLLDSARKTALKVIRNYFANKPDLIPLPWKLQS